MGSYGCWREPGMTDRAFFEAEFPSTEFLATATIGGTFYAAARSKDQFEEGAMAAAVFAIVCKVDRATRGSNPYDGCNFWYKPMDETVGPVESRAPAKILDLLTPTDSEWANEWRVRCRVNLEVKARAKDVKVGTKIRFSRPMSFSDGISDDTFEFLERSTFRRERDARRVRITAWRNRGDWEVAA